MIVVEVHVPDSFGYERERSCPRGIFRSRRPDGEANRKPLGAVDRRRGDVLAHSAAQR
jgi:hypothetical protein